ncbi:MAG: glycosyltransferase family 4 protein [Candidatus Bathyarchaeota archaeon]|nr:MAG: glycosyltransferase family 4 protein [Candidatus Bathyarchaeota archaeon]
MEIASFVYEFPPYIYGGLGTYAENVSTEIVKLNHDITLFSMHNRGAPTRDLYRGIEVHRPIVENMDISLLLPMFLPEEIRRWPRGSQQYFGDVFLYNVLSASKLINDLVRMENRSINIIVSHDWLGSVGGILASKGLDRPMVFHIHSTEQGRAGNGSDTIKRLEKLAGDHADRIITVSYAMRDHLISLGYNEEKIRVVYNGIDVNKYNPQRYSPQVVEATRRSLGICDDEFMIFFVGRLTWVKGADTLIQSLPQVLSSFPNTKLVIVGCGDQEKMLSIEVNRLGLTNNVILKFEFISEEEKIRYYAAADVCVFPSKYEPFGIVCTEAMAMGKPVIVGAQGVSGFREQIVPTGSNQSGFHINPYDPNDIAKYIITLLSQKSLRKQLGENARKRAMEMFTWQTVAENTLMVYEEIT